MKYVCRAKKMIHVEIEDNLKNADVHLNDLNETIVDHDELDKSLCMDTSNDFFRHQPIRCSTPTDQRVRIQTPSEEVIECLKSFEDDTTPFVTGYNDTDFDPDLSMDPETSPETPVETPAKSYADTTSGIVSDTPETSAEK